DARIVRIDLFRNITLEHDFLHYGRLLNLLEVPGADLKMHKTGIAWDGRGGLWGLTAYDKSVQAVAYLQKKGQGRTESGAANSVVPNNTMRVELKLLRRRAVTGLLGFELAKDLSANWAKLESVYETFLRRR